MHKFFFYNKFIIRLYMFRALFAHHQEVKIVLYSIWYHHTFMLPSGAQVESGLKKKKKHTHEASNVIFYSSIYRIILLFCIEQAGLCYRKPPSAETPLDNCCTQYSDKRNALCVALHV
jgi:hypothetical protein